MTALRLCLTWLRRTFALSNSAQAWQERCALAGVLAAALALWFFTNRLSSPVQLALWFSWLLLTALLFRGSFLKLFGPVLWYDMVRAARRNRFFWLRILYAGVLLFFWFTLLMGHQRGHYDSDRTAGARLAEAYFEVFMVVQFTAVLLLTPAYVAASIAEEKDRKTIEYLFATDLRNHEIVLSKFGSRLANLTLFLLTGLPILAILQFLGGIDPNLVLAGFAGTALTMFGLGGVALFLSVSCRKLRDAIALTYLLGLTYFILSLASPLLRHIWPQLPTTPLIGDWLVDDLVKAFNCGNVFFVLFQVQQAGFAGTLDTTLPVLLRQYALFHGILGTAGCLYAVVRLRAVALGQAYVPARARWLLRHRPGVGGEPMLWKETVVESGLRLHWIGWLIVLILVVLSFVPVASILAGHRPSWSSLEREMNNWVRSVGTLVACLMLLAVAVRAATAISSEREHQTFDGLVASPLTAGEILWAKWLGSMLSVRLAWLWLLPIWGLGVLTKGLHPLAIGLLVGAWCVYAGVLALLGLWFSLVCRTSAYAIMATLGTTLAISFAHWLPWMCCAFGGGGPGLGDLALMQGGATPPAGLALFAFTEQEAVPGHYLGPKLFLFPLGGLGLWAVGAFVLWGMLHQRFCSVTNREAFLTPDRRLRRQEFRLPEGSAGATPAPRLEEPPLTQLRGAKLIEEIWEPPPRPPASPSDH